MIRYKAFGLAMAVLMAGAATSAYAQTIKEEYEEFEAREQVFDSPVEAVGPQGEIKPAGGNSLGLGFEGISQFDVAAFGRNFIPPDTMGAVGKSQFMEFVNGGVAVFDKTTGTRTSIVSDVAFWASVGQTGANGDQRVLYNSEADRWIAIGFGANAKDIQIAVSDTSDALGTWKSTKFEGYAGFGFGATADYPTLAMDNNAVYIGTNNFAPKTAGGSNSFRGTTLDVIPLSSLFGAGAPSTTGLKKFETPYTGSASDDFTRGFAIQGVNSHEVTTTGNIIAVSLIDDHLDRYDILNAGTAGATRTDSITGIGAGYDGNGPGRQPSPINPRVIDTLDDRISGNVWEVKGKIYALHTITEIGGDFTEVRYDVLDSATGAVLDEGVIGGLYDYFQGSLAVNEAGQVVIAYNRSGSGADGKISFMARTYYTDASGHLVQVGNELLLHVSNSGDYHNGSIDGQAAAGRQRWGDYSAVTLDPENSKLFWAIGEFAREPNNAANGHPGGTGGTRWGTWIQAINFGVPEPSVWAMMILGFGFVGAAIRRRRAAEAV